nr:thioredoxin domain-containing protein 15 [Onthophagus taurus]
MKLNPAILFVFLSLLKLNTCHEDDNDPIFLDNIPIVPASNEETTSEVKESDLPTYSGSTNTTIVKEDGLEANSTVNSTQKYITCVSNFGSSEVQLVNDTELLKLLLPNSNITSREEAANCVVVLFYSKYCPFSSMAAPHFNALPRSFPDIKMVAINAMMYHLFNTQNGIVGVPSLLLFHNGRAAAKFNYSDYNLDTFIKFITKHTRILPAEKSFVTSADFAGPISSVPTKETDIFLGLSWSFIIICAIYYFTKSKWWKWIVDTIQSNWRESEAQHEHND